MALIDDIEALCHAALRACLPAAHEAVSFDAVSLETPRRAGQGELAYNGALVLAKTLRRDPMTLADTLAQHLRADARILKAECARPGFVNLTLVPDSWQQELRAILAAGVNYARAKPDSQPAVCVEYVSANPTGPMHVGHARGAVLGDVLANLLAYAGHKVRRSYYINDAGGQVRALARSVLWRLQEMRAEVKPPMPEGLYGGEYITDFAQLLAKDLAQDFWAQPLELRLETLAAKAVAHFMATIRTDLSAMGIAHDTFISEAALRKQAALARAIKLLEDKDLVYQGVLPRPKGKVSEDAYEPQPQMLFRAKSLGDDADRALKRPNGDWTYFAADIACHMHKYEAGYAQLINIWGADHGGYVKRLALALDAMYGTKLGFTVKLCHLVRLMRDGAQVKMSKRGGEFISLKDLVDEVGADVVRFIMLTRRHDAPLDFDFTLVTQKSKDNPVFYVQYAHARICSVLRQADAFDSQDLEHSALARADMQLLSHPLELALMRELAQFPRMLRGAVRAQEPHRLAFYAQNLAGHLHALWSEGKDNTQLRFLHETRPLAQARLALLSATAFVLRENLSIMGIMALEELR